MIRMTRRGTLRLPTFSGLSVRAAQGDSQQEQDLRFSDSRMAMGRTRLATRVSTLPRRADLYFAGKSLLGEDLSARVCIIYRN